VNELPTKGFPKIMTDVRDFDEDEKTGVPTIPVLLESPLKTRVVLTIVQAAVMVAFLRNPFIVASSCFAIALVWILGKDSPKVYFRLSLHSQTIFIVIYAVMFALSLL
jgi:4-hydroxybenzoate polyprenyltransferase